MARGTVTPTPLNFNGGTAGTATAVDTTNNHVVVVGDGLIRKTFLEVVNTGTVNGTVSVEPGVYPPAYEAASAGTFAAGTINVAVAAGGTQFIILEGAKVVQSDGQSIYLDYSPAGFVGNVYAFELPQKL